MLPASALTLSTALLMANGTEELDLRAHQQLMKQISH